MELTLLFFLTFQHKRQTKPNRHDEKHHQSHKKIFQQRIQQIDKIQTESKLDD